MKPILALVAFLALGCGHSAAEAKRPNILFILVDDQSPFDLKCYNPKSPLETPHIDRLAREGMVFDDAYHMGSFSGAVFTLSQHMIMSGRTVWHLPNMPLAMQKAPCPPNLEQQTIPAVFNRAGYATMRTCKQGNSYEAANQLFTVRHDATKRGGTLSLGGRSRCNSPTPPPRVINGDSTGRWQNERVCPTDHRVNSCLPPLPAWKSAACQPI